MKSLKACIAALGFACTALAAQATVTLADVKFEDTADIKGAKAQLNGAGIRYKAIFKVYAMGLYLPKKAGSTEEVLTMPGAKRIDITMLRDIDSGELGKLFSRGMEDNMDKKEFSKLIPGVMRMSQLFSECKMLKSGESFKIDWVPGTGMLIHINSAKCFKDLEPFKEPEFYNALVRIWLGPNPADWKLKEALLGKPA